MESIKLLEGWFLSAITKYKDVVFKYEFDSERKVHYIAVEPYDVFESNENYCKEENDLYSCLKKKYPNETFLFGKENVNFQMPQSSKVFKASVVLQKNKKDATSPSFFTSVKV